MGGSISDSIGDSIDDSIGDQGFNLLVAKHYHGGYAALADCLALDGADHRVQNGHLVAVELVGQRLGLDCRNVAALDDQLLDAGHVEGVAHDRGNGAAQQAHLAHGHPKDAQLVDTRVLYA